MIRFLAGLATGIGLAWAGLAIWKGTTPPPIPTDNERYYAGRPRYEDSTAGGIHHRDCQWPNRPCLCDIMPGEAGRHSFG